MIGLDGVILQSYSKQRKGQMKMKKNSVFMLMAMLSLPMAGMAQSSVERIGRDTVAVVGGLENMTVGSVYQDWLARYEEVGNQINEVSEQYQREVDKRGYPKKKTVQRKISLVEQYVQLLEEQLDTPALNESLDVEKVKRKIADWNEQLEGLRNLLEKI